MRVLRILTVLVLTASAALAARPVGRWDVVPDQRIDSTFKAGVVAFHPDGCKVEFRVNNTLVHTANNPTLNNRVDVWEFWFTFDPSNYSDGAVTLDAKVISLNGTDPDYDLPSLNLYANSGGSLDVSTVKWADSVNGSDSNPGTESQPYATLAKAVTNTPAGGTVYLKSGTYSAQSLGGGNTRTYWTTVSAAAGLDWDDVEISPGRPSTDMLKLVNLAIYSDSTSGTYSTILTGENGGNVIWLDNVKAYNKNGRYAASTNVFGNRYNAYTTGGITTEMCNGPGGAIVRDHEVKKLTSDVFTGENRLVVNCTVDDVDKGSTSAHPDFHQAYAPAPDYCENMIMYNVKATNMSCQGFFGHRLINSAFVNVLFERVPDVAYYSQYSDEMDNDLWFHITIVNQTWNWRGTGDSALDATDLELSNCIFGSMNVIEDASSSGLTIDRNHFSGSNTMGTNITTGDPQYVSPSTEDYSLQSSSPAYGTGKYLQCVPADIDGVLYSTTARNKGCYAGSGGTGNAAPVADAGADQTVTDTDDSGAENVTLDGTGSSDSDGTISSYVWTENSTQIATGSAPTVSFSVGSHTVVLTVTDDDSATDTDSVSITVNAATANQAPTADAGADQTVTDSDDSGAENVTLDGTGSSDSDGTISSYVWTEDSTQIATGSSPTVSFSVGSHTVVLTVTDDDSATDTDSVSITVNAAPSGGQTYTIYGHTDDNIARSNQTVPWAGGEYFRVGGDTSTTDSCAVYVFELPTLSAGETISTADFSAHLYEIDNNPGGAVDLYGLGYRSSSAVVGTDFYQGAYDGDTTDAWALQNDFADINTPDDTMLSTDATGDANLASYLAAQYTAGATGGDYVFIRINCDVADQTNYYYWEFTSANGSPDPVLTIETSTTASNAAPTADAGSDQTVSDADDSGAESITLDGSGSSDSDGTISSYVWEENSSQIATGVSPSVSIAVGSHTVDLTVTDDDGATDTDSVSVTVTAYVNAAPTADAGADQTVTDTDDSGAESVTLDGSGSSDSDGTISSYVWEENSTQIATGVSPAVSLAVGTHTITLTVTDDDSATDSDSVSVTVNAAPTGGSTYTIDGDTDDNVAKSDLTAPGWPGGATFRVGGDSSTTDACAVYVFELPTLGTGETVSDADFEAHLYRIANNPGGAVDLYGLGYRSSSTVLGSDFYQGSYDGDTTDAWALQNDFADINTADDTFVSTDSTGDANLASYLAAQYTAGAAGGDFVFIRINCDVADQTNYYYWEFTSANGTDGPILTIETTTSASNAAPVADAGADQTVTDSDGNGSASATLDGTGSSDSDGSIASYVWEEDSSQIATGSSPSVTLDVGVHTIDLTVTDDDSDTDTDSVEVTVVSRTQTSSTSSTVWPASTLPTQTGEFTVEFDVVPAAANIDGVTGLSSGAADWWDELACIVRFNTSGTIDVRDGSAYTADATMSYSASTTYYIRMVVDVPNATYSVYVTPAGGSETTLATDYDFRTEQASITSIDNWTLNATNSVGTHTVSNLTITD